MCFFFFFFQAEDGIRDHCVTGVQTCALPISWSWGFGDGGSSSSQNPSHTYGAGGTYTVRLTVTDDDGATGSTSQSVTVTAPNQPPRASVSASGTRLSGRFSHASSDTDGREEGWWCCPG